MDIIDFIIKLLFDIIKISIKEKEKANSKKAEAQKTLIACRNEIYSNRDHMTALIAGGKLKTLKVNDKTFRKTIDRLNTANMEKVRDYPDTYIKINNAKTAPFFDNLSLALYKIERLKELSGMTNKELGNRPPVRLTVRINRIIDCLEHLLPQKKNAQMAARHI